MTKRKAALSLIISMCVLTGCLPSGPVKVHMYGVGTGAGSLGIHTVKKNETVWIVAKKYNVPMRALLDINQLSPPYVLSVGTRLRLPAPNTYKVRKGDTLYTVSRLYNVSTTDLARQNALTPPYKLVPDTVITLPYQQEIAALPAQSPLQPPAPASVPVIGGTQRESYAGVATVEPPEVLKSEVAPMDNASVAAAKSVPEPAPPENKAQSKKEIALKSLPKTPRRSGTFQMPVQGNIISKYGAKNDGAHNDGLNIQAAKGTAVRASENGVVVYADNKIAGYGNLILIRHEGGYITAYAHLDKALAKRGQVVQQGETIGTVGKSGSVDKPQLHFEIRQGTKALDPKPLLAG